MVLVYLQTTARLRYAVAPADLLVSAKPGRQEVYVEHEIAPSIASLVRRGIAYSCSLSHLSAAAALAATLDATVKAVVEAAGCQSQSLSTGSGQSSRPVMREAQKAQVVTNVNDSFFRQRHQWKQLP
jgi:hypothetical protein